MPPTLRFPQFKHIATIFFSLCVLVFAIVSFGVGASTEVTVKPKVETRIIQTQLRVVQQGSDVGTSSGEAAFLAGEISRQSIEIQEPVAASRTVQKNVAAQYRIEVVNAYSRNQSLIATTRFLTSDEILYRTPSLIVVPIGKRVAARIAADAPGATRSLSVGERLTIPGLWQPIQDKIYGVVVALERPGVVVESEVVADDLIAAEQIVQRSREERIATLANAPEDTWVFLQEAEPVIRAPSLGVVENPKYVLTQEVLVVRVAKANLENSLRTFLGQMEKEKQPLFSLTDVKAEVSEVLGFEAPVEELEGAGGSIPPVSVPQSVRFVLSFPVQYYTPLVSGSIVTKDLRGKNEHAILDILREQYGIQDAGVVFRPEWLGRFATYFGPIKVTVLEP